MSSRNKFNSAYIHPTVFMKNIKILYFFLLSIFLCPLSSFGQNPAEWNFKVIQKDSISVGDTITFEIGKKLTDGYVWSLDSDSTAFERFEPFAPETTQTASGDVFDYKLKQSFIWWGFKDDTLKSLTFTLKKETDSVYFTTQPIYIFPKLFSAASDTALRPEKEIEATVRPWWHYFLWATAVLIAGFVLYFLYQRYKKKMTDVPEAKIIEIQKTPFEIFSEEMENLLTTQPEWQNDVKVYYSNLTEVLKRYLELKFNYHILEMTTDELLDWVKSEKVVFSSIPNLADILNRADLIKFAKQEAVLPQMISDFKEVKASVEKIENSPRFSQETAEPQQPKGEINASV